jgi:hypothetical protein
VALFPSRHVSIMPQWFYGATFILCEYLHIIFLALLLALCYSHAHTL